MSFWGYILAYTTTPDMVTPFQLSEEKLTYCNDFEYFKVDEHFEIVYSLLW